MRIGAVAEGFGAVSTGTIATWFVGACGSGWVHETAALKASLSPEAPDKA